MKVYTTQTIDSNKNLIIITNKYTSDGILKSIVTDTFDNNKLQILSESKVFYENNKSQVQFEICMNYKDKYTKTKSYYESGQIKGETQTIDNIYVLHTIYNEDGTIKKEWRTELSMSE